MILVSQVVGRRVFGHINHWYSNFFCNCWCRNNDASDPDLQGIGNSAKGLYISNGMILYDNAINGNHYIGTSMNGLMAGPVSVNGVLNVDGNFCGSIINKVMTVIRPNSISGINSITGFGGDINLFRADGTNC